MTENWLPIVGFEPYEVSDAGRVRRGTRILKLTPRKGYLRACLCLNNRRHFHEVHGLVARAFIGLKPADKQTAHRDGDRANNAVGNLAYKTRSENEADKISHGTYQFGSRNPNAKLTEADVAAIRAAVAEGAKQNAVAVRYGVSANAVHKIVKGRVWSQGEACQRGGEAMRPDAPQTPPENHP